MLDPHIIFILFLLFLISLSHNFTQNYIEYVENVKRLVSDTAHAGHSLENIVDNFM